MKKTLLLLLLLISWSSINAQTILAKTVSLSIENTRLIDILTNLSNQTKAQFTYDKNRIPTNKKFSLQVEKISLKKALIELFKNTNIQFVANKNYLTLFRKNIPYHTISGYIQDVQSGEALIEANVFETKYYRGCSSNEYGFYSLSLPEGKYVVKSRYIGYREASDTIELYGDINQNILLDLGNELLEILVIGNPSGDTSNTSILGSSPNKGERIDVEKAQALPTFMGEKDVLKYLQLLPGVVSGGLAGNNLYIRGGSLDQNLILLDDVPLYGVNHLFGLISVFNGDIVHSAKTYVAGFPARYGGQLSSVIDVRTKDGNKQTNHGGLSLGLFTATGYMEGPIQKDKSSYLFSARRTWLDLSLNSLNAEPLMKFYDLNAKVNFKISKKDRLYLSLYTGNDTFSQDFADDTFQVVQQEDVVLNWGNNAFALRWNRILGKKLFINTTLLRTVFNYNIDYLKILAPNRQNVTDLSYKSFIRQTGLKTDFSYLPNTRHHIRWGSSLYFMENSAGEINSNRIIQGQPNLFNTTSGTINAQQWTTYIEDDLQLNRAISLHPGIHFVSYKVQGKRYWLPQLRFQLNYKTTKNNHWALSYTQMVQFTHLLDNSSIESNNNKWVLATKNARPATSEQIALNFQSFFHSSWTIKLSTYYKKMKHLRRFQHGIDILNSVKDWEKNTAKGVGRSYGIEFLVAKTAGATQGWLTYTYAKSQRKFEEFAQSGYFPHQYDRRHSVNLTLTHTFPTKAAKKRQLSLVWIYASGNWLTVPQVAFASPNGFPLPAIDRVNNYQLPTIHRLDLSYLRTKITKKGFQHTWNFGIYNVYGQNNPFSAELQFIPMENTFNLVSNNLSVTPIPYVTYGFKF